MSRWERLRKYVHERPCLVGYVLLILVSVLAISAYQVHTNRRLTRVDEQACRDRNAIARNQVIVLKALLASSDLAPWRIVALQDALVRAGPKDCNE